MGTGSYYNPMELVVRDTELLESVHCIICTRELFPASRYAVRPRR